MANVISSLLVGVGLDFDEKSAKKVETGFDSVKSGALKLGAVMAGAFGVKALTTGFAASTDQLGKFADTYGLIAADVAGLDYALQRAGGSAGAVQAQLEGLEKFRANLASGDTGFLEEAEIRGIDTSALIEAKDATEAYLSLADQFQGMSKQQRLSAAEALGLDPAAIRMLSEGRASIKGMMAEAQRLRPINEELTNAASDFNDQLLKSQLIAQGLGDQLSKALLPPLIKVGELLDANSGKLANGMAKTVEVMVTGFETIYKGLEALGTFLGEGTAATVMGVESFVDKMTGPDTGDGKRYIPVTYSPGSGLAGAMMAKQQAGQKTQLTIKNEIDGQFLGETVVNIIDGSLETASQETASSVK